MSSVPTIFHLDMDAFFVSVEELFDPALKGKPVVVGGKAHERGVVSAASYAAREFGVHSAMPLRTAYKLCPQAIFVEGHPDRYRDYSHQVRAILENFTPLIEMASIDEAYLDMTGTGRLLGPPLQCAHALHQAIKDLLFIFDNLLSVEDRGIQTILRDVGSDTLALALRGAEPEVQDKIMRNMSKRAAEILRDDMEARGPVKLAEVEAAQKEIVVIAQRLAEEGTINLGGKDAGDYV